MHTPLPVCIYTSKLAVTERRVYEFSNYPQPSHTAIGRISIHNDSLMAIVYITSR